MNGTNLTPAEQEKVAKAQALGFIQQARISAKDPKLATNEHAVKMYHRGLDHQERQFQKLARVYNAICAQVGITPKVA